MVNVQQALNRTVAFGIPSHTTHYQLVLLQSELKITAFVYHSEVCSHNLYLNSNRNVLCEAWLQDKLNSLS